MCLINVAHEHFITQTGKKSKLAFINFIGPGAEGREKQIPKKKQLFYFTLKLC